MSKPFSSSANLRRRSRKETSPAPRKPKSKKSLSSSRSTRGSRNPKGSGTPRRKKNASLSAAALTKLAKIAEDAIRTISSQPVTNHAAFLKMSLFCFVAAKIPYPDTLRSMINWVHPSPLNDDEDVVHLPAMKEREFQNWVGRVVTPKPWQHEG